MNTCLACGKDLIRNNRRYCSNQCQCEYEYRTFIDRWRSGIVDGGVGVNARCLSGHVVRYLRSKYTACSICGWCETNPVTKRVPLEIDHIDGNSENNIESNLRLICPNCHALSPSFRNLNHGNGREWRRSKYLKTGYHKGTRHLSSAG